MLCDSRLDIRETHSCAIYNLGVLREFTGSSVPPPKNPGPKAEEKAPARDLEQTFFSAVDTAADSLDIIKTFRRARGRTEGVAIPHELHG